MQIREHEGVKGKRDFYPFDPRLLKIDARYNIRELDAPDEREALDELKEQIRESGVRVPLEVRLAGEDVLIVAGHRRHKVVMELIRDGVEIETVPIIHEPKWASDAERDLSLITSNSGKPLSPMQKAEVVRRLLAHGWDEKKIAAKIGVTDNTVRRFIEMLALPEAVKEQVKQGDVSATLAVKTVKNLPAGTDPALAAKLFADNKAENKKFGVGAKRDHKVTAKTLNRGKPNAKPTATQAAPKPMDSPTPPIQGVSEDRGEQDAGVEVGVASDAGLAVERMTEEELLRGLEPYTQTSIMEARQPRPSPAPALPASVAMLIEALKPFAMVVPDLDPDTFDDAEIFISDHAGNITMGHLRAAWRAWQAVTGGES